MTASHTGQSWAPSKIVTLVIAPTQAPTSGKKAAARRKSSGEGWWQIAGTGSRVRKLTATPNASSHRIMRVSADR